MINRISLFPLALILFCVSNTVSAQNLKEIDAVIMNDSKLRINGTSNVTDFQCIYKEGFESDTLTFSYENADSLLTVRGDKLALTINSFDCGKRGINRDFRNTLKSSVFPEIEIELLKIYSNGEVPDQAEVLIELAGQTRPYRVPLKEFTRNDGITMVEGMQHLKMSDFGLEPPSALFGLIKVRDDLRIEFVLQVREL